MDQLQALIDWKSNRTTGTQNAYEDMLFLEKLRVFHNLLVWQQHSSMYAVYVNRVAKHSSHRDMNLNNPFCLYIASHLCNSLFLLSGS